MTRIKRQSIEKKKKRKGKNKMKEKKKSKEKKGKEEKGKEVKKKKKKRNKKKAMISRFHLEKTSIDFLQHNGSKVDLDWRIDFKYPHFI